MRKANKISGRVDFLKAFSYTIHTLETKSVHSFLSRKILHLSLDETIKELHEQIKRKHFSFVVTLNTYGLMLSFRDNEFYDILNHADVITPDGNGILLGARLLGVPLKERVCGIDLIYEICKLCVKENYSLFLLGGKEESARGAKENLEKDFPGLRITGIQNGYFSSEEEDVIIRTINTLKPDVLLVGLGMPKQEKWIYSHRRGLQSIPLCMGIGGSFDVLSGKLHRAPLWVQNAGIEWLYRVLQEPKRIPRLWVIPYFLCAVVIEKFKLIFSFRKEHPNTP